MGLILTRSIHTHFIIMIFNSFVVFIQFIILLRLVDQMVTSMFGMVSTKKDCVNFTNITPLLLHLVSAIMVSKFITFHLTLPKTNVKYLVSGSVLAIGCSYFLEEDNPPSPLPDDAIYIRSVTDQETKPKYSSSS